MSVEIHIVDGPVGNAYATPSSPGAGAAIVFDGVVRGVEEGRTLRALLYEHYEPMAAEQLRSLAADVVREFGLIALRCDHSRGRVGVGECSMRVWIWSIHRREGLEAMGAFIDRLKKDVPIWKKVEWI